MNKKDSFKTNHKLTKTQVKSNFSGKQVDGIVKKNKNTINPLKIEKNIIDDDKRNFLKVAGIAGLGIAAATLLPKGADAYIAGSTPSSNVVGIKDSSNNKINPATEDTLDLIKQNSDKFNFDNDGKLLIKSDTVSSGVDIVGLKNSSDTRINPATEESLLNVGASVNNEGLWMLRKILTLLKPLGMVTGSGSNRLSVDINSGTVAISGTIGTLTTVTTVSTLTNLSNIGNVNSFSLMKDTSRNAYANGVRNNISIS